MEAYSKFSDEYGKVILSKIRMEELDDLEAKLVARAERAEARVKKLERTIYFQDQSLHRCEAKIKELEVTMSDQPTKGAFNYWLTRCVKAESQLEIAQARVKELEIISQTKRKEYYEIARSQDMHSNEKINKASQQ